MSLWPSCPSLSSTIKRFYERRAWRHSCTRAARGPRGRATRKNCCSSACSPLPSHCTPSSYHEQSPRFSFMSHSQHTPASSSNFQLIINNALEAYKKRTKNDLLAHPLAPQLQACDTPGAILAILQQQVQLYQSSSDDRWTKWLDPTVNVLFAFSATLGAGAGLVCSRTSAYQRYAPLYLFNRYSHLRVWSLLASAFSSQYVSPMTWHGTS